MPRHHLVPQFLLRNFANKREELRAWPRDDLTSGHPISVNRACNEIGFYRIEVDDLEPWARGGHDPEQVEKVLSALEGDAAAVVAQLIESEIPHTEQDLFHLAFSSRCSRPEGGSFATT